MGQRAPGQQKGCPQKALSRATHFSDVEGIEPGKLKIILESISI